MASVHSDAASQDVSRDEEGRNEGGNVKKRRYALDLNKDLEKSVGVLVERHK